MTSNFEDYLTRARAKHGEQFNSSQLAGQFVRYFRTGERIKVRYCDEDITGTVGITTGWKPCFLLMRRSNATGSSYCLSARDTILAVKRGNRYVSVESRG
jgi:hypothetical protein